MEHQSIMVQRLSATVRDSAGIIAANPVRVEALALMAIGAVALATRLYGLNTKPFWFDELITAQRAGLSPWNLIVDSFHNRQLPTFYLLEGALLRIAGMAALRLPSVLFGAICAMVTFTLTEEIGGVMAGLLAGMLAALAPFQVQMGQEARPYAMMTALILCALLALVRLVGQPPGERRSELGLYSASSVGALLVIGDALPWLLAANIGVFGAKALGAIRVPGFMRRWGWAQLLVMVVAAPFLIALPLFSIGHLADGFDWVPPLDFAGFWQAIAPVYLLRLSNIVSLDLLPEAVPGIGFAVLALAVLGFWHVRRRRAVLAVLLAAALVLPLVLTGISLVKPMLVPRYLVWAAYPVFIAAGLGLTALPAAARPALLAALALLMTINLAPYYTAETKPRWDLAADELAQFVRPGDMIVATDPAVQFALGAFAPQFGGLPVQVQTLSDQEVARFASGSISPGQRLWLVYGRVGQGPMDSLDTILQQFPSLGRSTLSLREGHDITILRFNHARPDPAGNNAR